MPDDSPMDKSIGDWATYAADQLKVGFQLGPYRLEQALGRGGMGEVWKAHDTVGDRYVAIKLVPPVLAAHPAEMQRVKETFQRIHALQHQHICPVYLLGEDQEFGYFVVMKFLEGSTLSQYQRNFVKRHGAFTVEETVRVLRPVADALDYAHAHKIVHRDVKPQNIMLADDGSDVQLVDFGLVAEFRTSMTRVSRQNMDSSGTYPYMSPEQWRGQYQDAATDQYALGVVAYELLSGRLPFEAFDAGILRLSVLSEEAEAIDGVPDYTNHAIKRAMAKERHDRFQNCVAFVEALESATEPAESRASVEELLPATTAVVQQPPEAEVVDADIVQPTSAGDVGQTQTPTQPVQVHCSGCGFPRKHWHQFCTRCGKRFSS